MIGNSNNIKKKKMFKSFSIELELFIFCCCILLVFGFLPSFFICVFLASLFHRMKLYHCIPSVPRFAPPALLIYSVDISKKKKKKVVSLHQGCIKPDSALS